MPTTRALFSSKLDEKLYFTLQCKDMTWSLDPSAFKYKNLVQQIISLNYHDLAYLSFSFLVSKVGIVSIIVLL